MLAEKTKTHLVQYQVEIELLEPMLGTIPANKYIFTKFIEEKKFDHQKKHGDLSAEQLQEKESEFIEELDEKGWTTFHKDPDKGLFIYSYMIKGFLKNAGNVLKDSLGIKNLRSKLNDTVFVTPMKIYLGKNSPDGILERSLRVMTMQGPRVALAKSDYVESGIKLTFTIRLINNKEITEETLRELFEYGKLMGLGQFRNGGYGKFRIKEFKVV